LEEITRYFSTLKRYFKRTKTLKNNMFYKTVAFFFNI
jgi:hypothetical protein